MTYLNQESQWYYSNNTITIFQISNNTDILDISFDIQQ